jgi:hypothetical protein
MEDIEVTLIHSIWEKQVALVHETYRGIFDKSSHLKSGCILEHGHKPLIMEEKSHELFNSYPRLEDNWY